MIDRSQATDLRNGHAAFEEHDPRGLVGDIDDLPRSNRDRNFARSGLPFATRVFDLRMMGHALAGGRVHRLGSVPSALFVYRGAQGDLVVCQMYEGRLEALRPASEERTHNGVRFRVYREGDLTLVFWQEGNVICVLAAAGDPESAVQLAFAKAAKA